MEMLYSFPLPLPGETIHSLVSRQHRLYAGSNVSQTLVSVFGKVTRTLDSDFPCCLAHMEGLLDVNRLIDEHTMLPLFEPFLGSERSQRARLAMFGVTGEGLKMSTGVTATGLERYRVRRFCPACLREDYKREGVSYWHVIHQASGVFVCPFHCCPLKVAAREPSRDVHRDLRMLDDLQILDHATVYEFSAPQLQRMTNLAKLICWGLTHSTEVSSLLVHDFLAIQVNRLGFSEAGRLRLTKLVSYLSGELATYPRVGECLRLKGGDTGVPQWPYRLLRSGLRTHHPLFYYCLLDLLQVTTTDLESFQANSQAQSACHSKVAPTQGALAEPADLHHRRAAFVADVQGMGIRHARGYTWLYRHDRDWLVEFVAKRPKLSRPKPAVDWRVRDSNLSELVRDAVATILRIDGKPIRITLSSLSRQLAIPVDCFKQAQRLPLTFSVLTEVVESNHSYQLRKVRWAAKALGNRKYDCARSVLLRLAGIRKCILNNQEFDAARECHDTHQLQIN